MSVTRRSFLRSGALTVLTTSIAAGLVPQAFGQNRGSANPAHDFQVPQEAKQSRTFYFNRDTFKSYVGGVFTARAGAKSVEMKLQSVRDCTPKAETKITKKSRPSDCFALVFRADDQLTDLTTIYDVEHAALGTFPLFMTFREGPQGVSFYEAVFNHAQ